jgi:hypothetical protein
MPLVQSFVDSVAFAVILHIVIKRFWSEERFG